MSFSKNAFQYLPEIYLLNIGFRIMNLYNNRHKVNKCLVVKNMYVLNYFLDYKRILISSNTL